MPTVPCNRQNPHLVVPHLIVRTPLPAGSEPVTLARLLETEDLVAANRLRIETLEQWREETSDPALLALAARITELENEVGVMAPHGMIALWGEEDIPAGWLLCDGSELSKTSYPDLWNAIGYRYGGADDAFNLPDLQKEFVRGHHADLGTLGAAFAASTKAPVSATAIPTSDGGASHKHTITAGTGSGKLLAAGAHTHGENTTGSTEPRSHTHGALGEPFTDGFTGAGGDHDHGAATGNEQAHTHDLGNIGGNYGAPLTAFAWPPFATPLPYDGPGGYYDTVYTGPVGTPDKFFLLSYPYIKLVENAWCSSPPRAAHNHSIAEESSHVHGIPVNSTIAHTHTYTPASDGSHSHSGETADATASHTHNVSKVTGWDSETRPQGKLMNFIIRY